MSVKPIPEGYYSVTPYLAIKGCDKAIDFYKKAFGATELFRMNDPSGTVGHAEIQIGNSRIMLSEEDPSMNFLSPETIGGCPGILMIYTENADETFRRAIENGAKETRPLKDQFYGDRSGSLKDPFGHKWTIATHIEDVSEEEMDKRLKEFMSATAAT